MQSRLISRKNELELELKLGVRDPQRKAYLTARLEQITRDIGSMGCSSEDIEKNNFAYDANTKEVGNQQFYVPLPSWSASEPEKNNQESNQNKANQEKADQDSVRTYREAMHARYNALEAEKNKKQQFERMK